MMEYFHDEDSEPEDLHFWMNEEDLGDLEHFYGGMMDMAQQDEEDLDMIFDDYGDPWYYSDEEEFDQDSLGSDSDHNKIFVTLQDSGAMRKLNFHKAVNDGRFRLPRISFHSNLENSETYESLHRVLEELEMLLKVWHKRTQHMFTAHICRPGEEEEEEKEEKDKKKEKKAKKEEEEPPSDEDKDIRYGVDYVEHDVEHESDAEEDGRPPPPGVPQCSSYNSVGSAFSAAHMTQHNVPLTKKKYCQSVRAYYDIFASEADFNQFLSYVHRLKKEVHGVLFDLFLGQLPDSARLKLPTELWEKVWRLTQTPYREVPQVTYCVGYRNACDESQEENEESLKSLLVEKDRVTDLFGAAGNLHMMVFEVLYKNSYITQCPPLMEVDSLDVKDRKAGEKPSYARALFSRFRRIMERSRERFSAITILEEEEEEEEEEVVNMLQCASEGRYTMEKQLIPVFAPKRPKNSLMLLMKESQFLVTSVTSSEVVALLDYEVGEDKQPYLRVIIWSVKRARQIAAISTDCTLLDVCCGRNQNATNQLFALTSDHFAFVLRSMDKERDTFTLIQWKFDLTWPESRDLDSKASCPVYRGDLEVNEEPSEAELYNRSIVSLKSATINGQDVFLLHHQSAYRSASTVRVLTLGDVGVPSQLLGEPMDFPGHAVFLECAKGERAIFRDEKARSFMFVDLNKRKVISTYKYRDLCLDAGHEHESNPRFGLNCVYEAKMDLNPARKEFAVFAQNMTCYQLFSYEDEEEPEVVASGSTLVHAMPFKMLSKTCLLNGVIVATPSSDNVLRTHIGDFFRDDARVYNLEVFGFDLREGKEVVPIAGLLQNSCDLNPVHEVVLTNDHSRRFHADILVHQCPYFVDDKTLLLPMLESYIKVEFHPGHRPGVTSDGVQLHEAFVVAREAKREEEAEKKREEERQKKLLQQEEEKKARKREETARLRAKYVSTGIQISGKVRKWNYSYGFVSVHEPSEARRLGDIFVHLSEFTNRGKRLIKIGQKVTFRIEPTGKEHGEDKIKAVHVEMMDPQPAPPKEAASGLAGAVGGRGMRPPKYH